MPNVCNPPIRALLKDSISNVRKWIGTQRGLAQKIESIEPLLKADTQVFQPMLTAQSEANVWKAEFEQRINKIARGFSAGQTENVMAAIIDPNASRVGFSLSTKEARIVPQTKALLEDVLQSLGLSKEQAGRFLTEDFTKLRAARGDATRLSAQNIYPETFQPFMEEIFKNGISATQNNAYAFAQDLISMGARMKFMNPAAKRALATVDDWAASSKGGRGGSLTGKVDNQDLWYAQQFGREFINAQKEQRSQFALSIAQTLGGARNRFRAVLGKEAVEAWDDKTINRMSSNMASWFGGSAMSGRMALPIRNLTQSLLPALKVGHKRVFQAYKDIYGDNREKFVPRMLKDLGMPESGNQPVQLLEAGENFLANKIWRGMRDLQNTGLRPFRWSDKNNRLVAFRSGELAIEQESKALLANKASWEEFLFATGLKGSPKVVQRRIKALLQGTEHPNVQQAAREYGKQMVADTQFLYGGLNAPLAFKGTFGRLFGQFGTWPIGFTEYMHQNISGNGFAWGSKFAGNYGIQKSILAGMGIAAGVDTSSWNYANPLTFQGGPWFQLFRDTSVLATSVNEFERREAFSNFRRMTGITGNLHTGTLNPFGAATGDVLQGVAEAGDPLRAMLLTLGFNLRDSSLATKR